MVSSGGVDENRSQAYNVLDIFKGRRSWHISNRFLIIFTGNNKLVRFAELISSLLLSMK